MIKNNTTIDQLVQVSEMDNLYILGTQNGTARKYPLNVLKSEIELQSNSVGFPFDPSTTYAKDEYCVYNNGAYKFNKGHSGEWVAADADRVYMLDETLDKIFVDNKNILDIHLMYSDSSVAVSNATVTISFADGTSSVTTQTDSNGVASATISRDKEFTVSVNDINGYVTPTFGHYRTFNTKQKIFGIYKAIDVREDASVTVHVDPSYGVSSSSINGKALTAYIDGSYYYSANIMDNMIKFGCKQGGTVTVIFPIIPDAKTPYAPDGSISATNKNLGTTVTVDSANYSIQATYLSLRVPKPTIIRDSNNLITITDDWTDALIYYTTDLSEPTTSSNLYSAPFTSDANIHAIAVKNNYLTSNITFLKSPLPSIYQEVEYLQSNGNQYIATGIPINDNTIEIYTKVKYPSANIFLLGQGQWSTNVMLLHSNLTFYYSTGTAHNNNTTLNEWHELYLSSTKFTCDSNTITYSSGTSGLTGNLYLMGSPSLAYRGNNFSSYCNIKKNGEYVRLLTACYRKSDSKPGYYDHINNVFYTNAGTGEFTVGPDV